MRGEESSGFVQTSAAFDKTGLTLGSGSRLVRFDARTGRLALASDRERCLTLLAVAGRGSVEPSVLLDLEAAAGHWDRGDRALANLRLVFSGLPRLHDAGDAARLRAAEYLLDHGMTARELLKELEIDATAVGLEKYDPDQPRVPAGQGKESGRWIERLGHWLAEDVPVYDQDTGDEVGTRSRGSAIATNPLTIIGAGAAALLAGEAAVAAASATALALSPEVTIADAIALLPEGMDVNTFGRLAGFAQGLIGSSEASTEAAVEILQSLRGAGVTRQCISAFRKFYADAARKVPKNLSAIERTKILSNIERAMKWPTVLWVLSFSTGRMTVSFFGLSLGQRK